MNHLIKIINKLKQLSNGYGREAKVSFSFDVYRKIIVEIQGSSYFFVITRLYGLSDRASFDVSIYRNVYHPEFDFWLRDEFVKSVGLDNLDFFTDELEQRVFRDTWVEKIERYQRSYRLSRVLHKRSIKILNGGVK